VDPAAEQFGRNCGDMLEQLGVIDALLDEAAAGGGQKAMDRMRSRGKMPVRERIAAVLDPNSPFLEISPLAGYGSDYALGGGMVIGIGVIAGTECVILANDPSVLGGALTPYAWKKWARALEIARDNRMPYVSFVESAGADLRVETDNGGGRKVNTTHFAESGRFFYELIELSKMRIPTVCVVFGSSTAGGAYQPGLSDYNIVVKGQSKIFLAGPPLVKMATGEESDDESLGGAALHAEVSGLGDYFAEDEMDALRICREVVSHLNWRKAGPEALLPAEEPAYDAEELLGLVSRDLRQPVDVRNVIARVADGSRFEEFKARYGPTVVCGWTRIHGYPVGVLGNNGVIYPDAAEKAAHFIQLCNQIDVPLLFLQNITGYIVGREFEAAGIIKKGSQMLNAVSNSTVPHLTVIIGASYGAAPTGCRAGRSGTASPSCGRPPRSPSWAPSRSLGSCPWSAGAGPRARASSSTRRKTRRSSPWSRRSRNGGPSRSQPPARSVTTGSSTRTTRAPCSGCACRWCATGRSPGPRATGCSGCDVHQSARRQPRRDRPARHAHGAPDGHPLHRRLHRQ